MGLLVEGSPAEQIVRVATSRRVDLIVMGTHGHDRTSLAGLFLESVTDRVIAMAPCPVLTLRDRPRARRA